MRKFVLLFLLSFLLSVTAAAWNSRGHRIIVSIAYARLDVDARAALGAMLRAHPEFGKWERQFGQDGEPVSFDLYLLMRASDWADEIRRGGNTHNHPRWHYTNYPLQPPDFPVVERLRPGADILTGFDRTLETLSDRSAAAEEKAVALSWLIHLVGDVHHPLHTVAWMGQGYPDGDRGGNEFFVRVGSRGVDLHRLWDELPGRDRRAQSVLREAVVLRFRFDDDEEMLRRAAERNPEAWALESRQVAIDEVYLRGHLAGARRAGEARPVPPEYFSRAGETKDRQLMVAGLRLAALLQDLP